VGGIGVIEFTITYVIQPLDIKSPVFFIHPHARTPNIKFRFFGSGSSNLPTSSKFWSCMVSAL
jgi:hypothetical protein